MDFLKNILGPAVELSPWGFVLRTVLVGILLWAEGKILPHRSGGQFAGYDFTFFWMMGGITAAPLFEPKISFSNVIAIIAIIYLLHYLLSFLMVKNRAFAKLITGEPIPLVSGGKIIRRNMAKALFPLELLFSELRSMNAPNIHEVQEAVLETNGHVSVVRKAESQPVTPAELNIPTAHIHSGLPVILIHDGFIQPQNLKKIGRNQEWLKQEISKNGILNLKDVYYAQVDAAGTLYVTVK